ncbi:MAG: MerR family transcriptional regulator [Flavicella sp.]|nr:MerR family transcriptional regulator [Flavicella sp.]
MNKIKDSFLIQDLETLSGIKAHTIRIWEKRYNLLNPERLNRNIRKYTLTDLQKLLNVSILYSNGYKISKLSLLSDEELHETARKISLESVASNYNVNTLILAMYAFDGDQFDKVYNELSESMGFEELFVKVYIPLLDHIGVLWQTDAIKPAHEHFISNLIIGKIVLNTAEISSVTSEDTTTYVLYLPVGELHSLGLLFLNYCLKKRGKKTVYLGGGIPFSNLQTLNTKFPSIKWICSFVVERTREEKEAFLFEYVDFLKKSDSSSLIVGRVMEEVSGKEEFKERITFFNSFKELPFFE